MILLLSRREGRRGALRGLSRNDPPGAPYIGEPRRQGLSDTLGPGQICQLSRSACHCHLESSVLSLQHILEMPSIFPSISGDAKGISHTTMLHMPVWAKGVPRLARDGRARGMSK